MQTDNIVQFVGFVTKLKLEDFSSTWEHYTKQFKAKPGSAKLLEVISKTQYKYRYLSQHTGSPGSFRFAFMKGTTSEHFPEQTAKVVQMGGYTPVQIQYNGIKNNKNVKVMAFLDANENELAFYRDQKYEYLNIYQAYYENCSYGYILEFFVDPSDSDTLMENIKTANRVEMAVFNECQLSHAK